MFGFPFVTSLIVVMALVIVFSFVINKGIKINTKNSQQKQLNIKTEKRAQTIT